MATETTTEVTTIVREVVKPLVIIPKFKELMKASTEDDSMYLKAKDTVTALVKDSSLTGRERADLVSAAVSGIATAVTAHAMDVALKMAIEDRDAPFALTKMREETQLIRSQANKIDSEDELVESKIKMTDAEIDYKIIQGWNIQSDMYRENGFNTSSLSIEKPILPHLGTKVDYGTKFETSKGLQAANYDKWASTLMQNGDVNFNIDSKGMPTGVVLSEDGMTMAQIRVTDRQRLAFDDNMRQHVLNGSASMLGVMIGSETFEEASAYTRFLDKWDAAADYLNTDHFGSAGDIAASFSDVIIGSEYSLTGTTVNILAGTSVVIKFYADNTVYGGATIVNEDGTWAIVIASSLTAQIQGTTGTILYTSASLIDGLGRRLVTTHEQVIT